MTLRFDMVAAADEELGIGRDGAVPWDLPGDVAFFKRITSRTTSPDKVNAVVMGRKTWDTIPDRYRPLRRRLNVVVTRNRELALPEGVLLATSVEHALTLLKGRSEVERVFVIGGGEIYRLGLARPECDRVYLTRVEGRHGCDAFFPPLGEDFTLQDASERHEHDGVGYVFEIHRRG